MGPAVQSLAPNLVPESDLPNAIAWNSSSWQLASILGPVAGGLLYGVSPVVSYSVALTLFALSAILAFMIRKPEQRTTSRAVTLESMLAGFRFISHEKVVLGAISLDLFAVLLGGAVALMPIFAKEVLTLGPWGLGLLRAAQGIGAILVAIFLAFHPIRHHAGVMMFAGVALFGAGTVVFGLSATPWMSIAALVVMGAADMVSVYVRETLIALWTRMRYVAVSTPSTWSSSGRPTNLANFRAGSMASVFGAVHSVVIGGDRHLMVAAIWAARFPSFGRSIVWRRRKKFGPNDPGQLQHFDCESAHRTCVTPLTRRSCPFLLKSPSAHFRPQQGIRDCGLITDQCGWINSRSMRRSSGQGVSS